MFSCSKQPLLYLVTHSMLESALKAGGVRMHAPANLAPPLHAELDGMREREEEETDSLHRSSVTAPSVHLVWTTINIRLNSKGCSVTRRGWYRRETVAVGDCQAIGAVVGEGDAVVAPEE